MKDTIVIIPSCSDLNRGDQALVWETKKIAEEAGYKGDFYFQTEKDEPVEQSIKRGLNPIYPILEHPSTRFKKRENIQYTVSLKIKWGVVAIGDLCGSLFLLWRPTRKIAYKLLSSSKRKTYDVFKRSKAVFMKGGGLLQTYGGLSSSYSMYFWTYPILLASSLGKVIYVMPNSFGPFEGPFVKRIARHALKKCKLVTSRETISQFMVGQDLGLKIENYADLAFELKENTSLEKKKILEKFDIPTNKKLVALTMRPYRFPNASDPPKAYEYFKNAMAEFIRWIYSEGYMPVLVEHTLAVNAHENDGECIKEVIKKLSPDEYRVISNANYDCEDLKRIYGFFDYIVGTRFHSMIFSFGNNVPGVAIAYTGNKSQGIMHDMGLDDYVINISEVSAEKLKEKFTDLVNNREAIVEKIQRYRKKATIDYEKLRSRIKEN